MATETVRFSRVVQKSGQPETYTLWAKPEQDKVFTALLKKNRVMTLHQETVGAKADYGSVGYTQDRHGSLLVFPKSLKSFEGKRVIGIKYEELKGAESTNDPPPASEKKPARKKPGKKKAPPSNQIAFPKPEIVKRPESEKTEPAGREDAAEELAHLKKVIEKALDALSKDKPVTAFNLLKATVD